MANLIEKTLVVSLKHLPPDEDTTNGQGMIIRLDPMDEGALPPWLFPLWDIARQYKCSLILFDVLGDVLEDVKIYPR